MKCKIQPRLICSLFILSALHAQNFHMVKDINDSKDGNPSNSVLSPQGGGWSNQYAVLNNIAYFSATGGLWRSDGTRAGTYLLKSFSSLEEIVVMGIIFISVLMMEYMDGSFGNLMEQRQEQRW